MLLYTQNVDKIWTKPLATIGAARLGAFAWVPARHSENPFGIGFLTPCFTSGEMKNTTMFDSMASESQDDFYKQSRGKIPLGSRVRYASLMPLTMYSFTGCKRLSNVISYGHLESPVTETKALVYNGRNNSGGDPRLLLDSVDDLWKGCQSQGNSYNAPSVLCGYSIVVNILKVNMFGGILIKQNLEMEIYVLKSLKKSQTWTIRAKARLDTTRSKIYPNLQTAAVIFYRVPMGRNELTGRRIYRDLNSI